MSRGRDTIFRYIDCLEEWLRSNPDGEAFADRVTGCKEQGRPAGHQRPPVEVLILLRHPLTSEAPGRPDPIFGPAPAALPPLRSLRSLSTRRRLYSGVVLTVT
jgi:hypothetical protein